MSEDVQDKQSLGRLSVPEMDAVLGVQFPVLDSGFVRAVDYMGGDAAIVQAARVSYGAGTKRAQEDSALINYLLRHSHTTPFEMCELKLHVRVPMDCWRQWIRHRTANVNEYSTRYSVAIDAAQHTEPGDWRMQSDASKQGSDGYVDSATGKRLSEQESELQRLAWDVYQERLRVGVAREQARKDLPLSTFTEAYWKIDLHNLLHFLRLRMAPDAQVEIRAYAHVIGEQIVARWCPVAWRAFREYQFGSLSFSSVEQEILRAMLAKESQVALTLAVARGWLDTETFAVRKSRERQEFERKISGLGVSAPWTS